MAQGTPGCAARLLSIGVDAKVVGDAFLVADSVAVVFREVLHVDGVRREIVVVFNGNGVVALGNAPAVQGYFCARYYRSSGVCIRVLTVVWHS
jgi:hypothetical protein